MSDEAIVPGIRIGEYHLGERVEKITELLEQKKVSYSVVPLGSVEKLVTDGLSFWVTDGRISQITATEGFGGRINGVIGVGSTLRQAEECLGRIREGEYDIVIVYELEGVPGVCFELKDDDEFEEFDEMSAPIEAISIYKD